MMRKEEGDEDFKKQLQNPLKPINDTSLSPETEKYLKDLNEGTLKSEETLRKEKEKAEEKDKKVIICPKCRRPNTIKRIPSGYYCCGQCGLTSNSPLGPLTPVRTTLRQ